jgi:cation:H+ antiporter
MLVGATLVSLSTTLPEAAVSVWASIMGHPEIALGNAVGSIICDTGLILGLSVVLCPIPLEQEMVRRQGWIQFGSGVLLVLACIPVVGAGDIFRTGGRLPQSMGFVFLGLLAAYLWLSVRWARRPADDVALQTPLAVPRRTSVTRQLARFSFGAGLVVAASQILIPTIQETSVRLAVPESIVSATLVAFGTSLPELVTAITAVRKNQGGLAVGNVIGADILNVLFVGGASAAVTRQGLTAPAHFFQILFPAMLFVLVVFRVGVVFSGDRMKRSFGSVLIATYLLVTVWSYHL